MTRLASRLTGDQRAALLVAAVWSFAACVLGPLLTSLVFVASSVTSISISPRGPFSWESLPSMFENGYVAFAIGGAINALAFPPLTLVLWGYGLFVPRRAWLDKRWRGLALGSLVMSIVCGLGAGLPAAIAIGVASGSPGPPNFFGIFPIVAPVSFVALLAARFLVPGLQPGAFLSPESAVGCFRRALGSALRLLIVVISLTAATAVVESVVSLPCVPQQGSCYEAVRSRGLPYPFLQRTFRSPVFVYDVLIFALVPVTWIAIAARWRRLRARAPVVVAG